jgi:hypothetical protein
MSNEKQQTSIEWLGNEITNRITRRNPHDTIIIQILGETLIELIEIAKEMEKEHKINFTYNYINSGSIGCLWDGDSAPELDIDTDPKQFYEQTYGGNK